jgi:hypothetical protein
MPSSPPPLKIALCYPGRESCFDEFRDCLEFLIDAISKRPDLELFRLRLKGCSLLAQARSVLAERAVEEGADVILWIDDDIVFEAEDAISLCESANSGHPIIGAVCSTKRPGGQFTARFIPGTGVVGFFEKGKIIEIEGIGCGFTAVHRDVYLKAREYTPLVKSSFGGEFHAYYREIIRNDVWLGEDISFCIQAREHFPVFADTRIRAGHWGAYRFRLEDIILRIPTAREMMIDTRTGQAVDENGKPIVQESEPEVEVEETTDTVIAS